MEIAGIYLERDGGLAVSANAEVSANGHYPDNIIHKENFSVKWSNREEAQAGIRQIGEFVKDSSKELSSLGVACYGPFKSLDDQDQGGYGRLLKELCDEPLSGENLFETFQGIVGQEVTITVTTDALAVALGEAILRGLRDNEILAFICVTEGVGLGIVQGKRIVQTALHSEFGMIPLRPHEGDPVSPQVREPKIGMPYSGGLSKLANNESMRLRASDFHSDPFTDDRLCKYRAFYLAQACFSVTGIFPPHYIVIGADHDPNGDIAVRVNKHFRTLIQDRIDNDYPVFQYEHLKSSKFISNSINSSPNHLATTGALGMCHLAAAKMLESKQNTGD